MDDTKSSSSDSSFDRVSQSFVLDVGANSLASKYVKLDTLPKQFQIVIDHAVKHLLIGTVLNQRPSCQAGHALVLDVLKLYTADGFIAELHELYLCQHL